MGEADADLDALSDDALMVLFARGDAGAARLLTARLLPRVVSHAARVLGNRTEAEDVAQEAMLRLWRAAPDWRPDGAARPRTWLYRVTANLATDRMRARRPTAPIDAAEAVPDGEPSAAETIDDVARLSALDAALATLPDRQRQAVVLRHIEGLSNPEIGAVLDISVEAVESLTARGRRALAAALEGKKEALGYGD
ncbi:MAG: RNA polymerase sigma factor [Pseudomonadota bacterium]